LQRISPVHLVRFVHLVNLVQPNKRDKPNKPDQPAGSHASRLFSTTCHVVDERSIDVGATEADGIEEGIGIRYKILLVG
jgi:hypothetical protein